MEKNFSKTVFVFSLFSAAVMGILFITIGIGAILLIDKILPALIYTSGIFLLLLGTFLLSGVLLVLLLTKVRT